MSRPVFGAFLVSGLIFAGAATPAQAQDGVHTVTSATPFAQVIGDLEDAIVNRGYVIDYHGHIGDMLERTAADVGGRKLYRNAEFLQFCSAVVSRNAMEADIANIAFCPYVVFAYEAEAKPGEVTIGFRELPPGPGRDEVNTLLTEIVDQAANGL
ncbi:DUF302 domain-containing protein [Aquamicrobium ahrensii]|uniref:Uncharacterized protein (DUF302 family) n=1 Tax=Aquamicrobium ahrensii TaxID=469551 RepID=A0ABV2KH46_9HYPH